MFDDNDRDDLFWIESHMIDHSDDFRFVGYKSDPEALLNRALEVQKEMRGETTTQVSLATTYESMRLDQKRDALANLINENRDDELGLDDHLVSSYISKLVDEYSVNDHLIRENNSVELRGLSKFYPVRDPDLIYTTYEYENDSSRRQAIFDISTGSDFDEYFEENLPDSVDIELHTPNEFYYVSNDLDSDEGNVVRESAMYRGFYIADVVGYMEMDDQDITHIDMKDDFYSKDEVVSANDPRKGFEGIYKIENDGVYRYNLDETKSQKIIGEGSVAEAIDLKRQSVSLNDYRISRFKTLVEELDLATERMDDFDLSGIKPDITDVHMPIPPKMTSIDSTKELEHDLEP